MYVCALNVLFYYARHYDQTQPMPTF